jgi:hypothetical protein
MSNAGYYRKQAEICARLARAADSSERATRFKVLGLEMLLRAKNASSSKVAVAPVGSALPAACDRDQ